MIELAVSLYWTISRLSVASETSKPMTPPSGIGTPTETPGSFDQAKR